MPFLFSVDGVGPHNGPPQPVRQLQLRLRPPDAVVPPLLHLRLRHWSLQDDAERRGLDGGDAHGGSGKA